MSIVRIGRGTIYVAIQSITTFVIGLLYYSTLARLLTKSEIGLLSTMTLITSIYSLLATLNLPVAATKYMSEYIGQNNEERASAVAKRTLKLVLLLSTLLLVPALLIPWLYMSENPLLSVLMMISCITAFLGIIKSTYLSFLGFAQ